MVEADCTSPHEVRAFRADELEKKMPNNTEALCPKCHAPNFKPWPDLDRDEQIAAMARPTKYTRTQRKKHRICTRCWFEQSDPKTDLA